LDARREGKEKSSEEKRKSGDSGTVPEMAIPQAAMTLKSNISTAFSRKIH